MQSLRGASCWIPLRCLHVRGLQGMCKRYPIIRSADRTTLLQRSWSANLGILGGVERLES